MHHLIIIVVVILLTFILTLGFTNRDRQDYNRNIDNIYKLWSQHAVYTRLDIIAKIDERKSGQPINYYRLALVSSENSIGDILGLDKNKFLLLMGDFHIAVDNYIGSVINAATINTIIDTATVYETADKIGKFLDKKIRLDSSTLATKIYADNILTLVNNVGRSVSTTDDTAAINSLIQSEM